MAGGETGVYSGMEAWKSRSLPTFSAQRSEFPFKHGKNGHNSLHPPEAPLQGLQGNNKGINGQRERGRKRQQMRDVNRILEDG